MSPKVYQFSLRWLAIAILSTGWMGTVVWAQQGPVANKSLLTSDATVEPISGGSVNAPEPRADHRFWDRDNLLLFSTVAGMSSADFAITNANIQSGGRELDPAARVFGTSTAGLATNFAAETAGVIGISYLFHKTGHHRLERMTSVVNISASTFAVAYDIAHKTK
jgi:hypothetical protein